MGTKHLHKVAQSFIGQLRAVPADLRLDQDLRDPHGHDQPSERIYEKHGAKLARLVGRMTPETLGKVIADGRAFTLENQRNGFTPLCAATGPGAKRITLNASGGSILRQLATAAIVAEMTDILTRQWNKVEFDVFELGAVAAPSRFFVTASHPSFGIRYLSHLGVWLLTTDGALEHESMNEAKHIVRVQRDGVNLQDILRNLRPDDPARLKSKP